MIEVKKHEYALYSEAFSHFSDVIAVDAILRGHSKGKLYIDNDKNPEVLVIWNEFDGFYISMLTNQNISTVKEFIKDTTKNACTENNEYVIYIDRKFDKDIGCIIPANEYEKLDVLFFSTNEIKVNNGENCSYTLSELSKMRDLNTYSWSNEIIDVIESTWSSYDEFITYGESTVLISEAEKKILGYCISEHVTEDSVEFSIEIDESCRRQGLGTILGQAMLDTCREKKKKPCWYCTDDNSGSIQLARKIGLELQIEFHVWYFQIGE